MIVFRLVSMNMGKVGPILVGGVVAFRTIAERRKRKMLDHHVIDGLAILGLILGVLGSLYLVQSQETFSWSERWASYGH
jgi:hypothetical protein